MQPNLDANSWSNLAGTIDQLITNNPASGLFTIVVTALVFAGILIGSTWAVVRIIRARYDPPKQTGEIFNREQYTLNILLLIRDMHEFNARRDTMSRASERIREHVIVRDQMSLVEANIDYVHSNILISFSEYLREKYPDELEASTDFPVYRAFDVAMRHSLSEVTKVFRRVAKENHLADRNEENFHEYCDQKLEQIKTFSYRMFEASYSSRTIPTHEILNDFEKEWKKTEPIYRRTLKDMRSIAVQYAAEINKKEAEFDAEWSEFISGIPERLADGVTTTAGGKSAIRGSKR